LPLLIYTKTVYTNSNGEYSEKINLRYVVPRHEVFRMTLILVAILEVKDWLGITRLLADLKEMKLGMKIETNIRNIVTLYSVIGNLNANTTNVSFGGANVTYTKAYYRITYDQPPQVINGRLRENYRQVLELSFWYNKDMNNTGLRQSSFNMILFDTKNMSDITKAYIFYDSELYGKIRNLKSNLKELAIRAASISTSHKVYAFIGIPDAFSIINYTCLFGIIRYKAPLKIIEPFVAINIPYKAFDDLSYYNLSYIKSSYIDVLNKKKYGCGLETIKDILELALNTGKPEYIYTAMNSTLLAALSGLLLSTPSGKEIFKNLKTTFEKELNATKNESDWAHKILIIVIAILTAGIAGVLIRIAQTVAQMIGVSLSHLLSAFSAGIGVVISIALGFFAYFNISLRYSLKEEDYRNLIKATEYSFNPYSIDTIVSLTEVDLAIFKYLVTLYYQMK